MKNFIYLFLFISTSFSQVEIPNHSLDTNVYHVMNADTVDSNYSKFNVIHKKLNWTFYFDVLNAYRDSSKEHFKKRLFDLRPLNFKNDSFYLSDSLVVYRDSVQAFFQITIGVFKYDGEKAFMGYYQFYSIKHNDSLIYDIIKDFNLWEFENEKILSIIKKPKVYIRKFLTNYDILGRIKL